MLLPHSFTSRKEVKEFSPMCYIHVIFCHVQPPPQHLFSVLADLLTDSEAAEPQARRVYTVCFIPKPPPCPP